MAHSLAEGALDQTTERLVDRGRETPLVARSHPAVPEQLPRPFGRYMLQRLLGRGAMGTVYLAHDSNLDRLVALKIPRPLDEDPDLWRERFLSEARAAATLHHPHICPVHEVGEIESQPYLTMAYIEGETLAAHLRRSGSLPINQAVSLLRTISRAMADAHERGIIHRDLKPANIMLDRRNEPVIMDFGLALRVSASDDLRLTLSGVALGTPCYMPPEQAGGDHAAIGPASDVYSLGVILFELVTGQVPFQARTFGKLLAQIERDPAPPPESINPQIDERLSDIIARALAKDPSERFASAAALADALDGYLAGAPSPAGSLSRREMAKTRDWISPSAPKSQAKDSQPPWWQNRRFWGVGAGGGVLAVLLGVVIYVLTNNGQLVVELSDPDAKVAVKVNGEEVILDSGDSSVRVRAGKNQKLDVSGPGYESKSESFDLKRGGRTVVRVTLVPTTPAKPGVIARVPSPAQPTQTPSKPKTPAAPPMEVVFRPPGLIEIPGWHLLTGANQQDMQTWLDERKKAKHSVQWLDVDLVGGQPVFAAIAALDERASDWHAFLDLTDREVNDVAELAKRLDPSNYVVTSISGYVQGKKLTGVALYHRGKADGMAGVPSMLNAKANLTVALSHGYVVRVLRPVPISASQVYCGLYIESALGTASRHAFELSEAELTKMLDVQREEGAHPVSVVPYMLGGQQRFAASFREDATKAPWELVRDLSGSELKAKAAELARKEMTPVSISVTAKENDGRYNVVWRKDSQTGPASP